MVPSSAAKNFFANVVQVFHWFLGTYLIQLTLKRKVEQVQRKPRTNPIAKMQCFLGKIEKVSFASIVSMGR